MSEELRENLAASLQKLLPLLTSIILVLMSYVPLNFAAANNLRPAVGLMCIFACLIMYLLVSNLAVYLNGKPFVVTWYGFAVFCLITMFSRWLLVSVYYSQFLPLSMLMFNLLFTIAFYPVIGLVNAFVQNKLMKDEG